MTEKNSMYEQDWQFESCLLYTSAKWPISPLLSSRYECLSATSAASADAALCIRVLVLRILHAGNFTSSLARRPTPLQRAVQAETASTRRPRVEESETGQAKETQRRQTKREGGVRRSARAAGAGHRGGGSERQ